MGCLEKRERFVLDYTKGTWGLLDQGFKSRIKVVKEV